MGLVYLVPIAGILAVAFAFWLAWDVLRRDTGTPAMQDVAGLIFEGAMAFLRRQYLTIAVLAVAASVVIAVVVGAVSEGVREINRVDCVAASAAQKLANPVCTDASVKADQQFFIDYGAKKV